MKLRFHSDIAKNLFKQQKRENDSCMKLELFSLFAYVVVFVIYISINGVPAVEQARSYDRLTASLEL